MRTQLAVETVHRLLFRALQEMRSQGYEAKNNVVFHLADLFHNTVLEMESAASGQGTFDEVLRHLEEYARAKGLEQWLNANLERVGKQESE